MTKYALRISSRNTPYPVLRIPCIPTDGIFRTCSSSIYAVSASCYSFLNNHVLTPNAIHNSSLSSSCSTSPSHSHTSSIDRRLPTLHKSTKADASKSVNQSTNRSINQPRPQKPAARLWLRRANHYSSIIPNEDGVPPPLFS
jgi:hypothetical protein